MGKSKKLWSEFTFFFKSNISYKFLEHREHPDSAWKQSSKNCMKLISAECAAENS